MLRWFRKTYPSYIPQPWVMPASFEWKIPTGHSPRLQSRPAPERSRRLPSPMPRARAVKLVSAAPRVHRILESPRTGPTQRAGSLRDPTNCVWTHGETPQKAPAGLFLGCLTKTAPETGEKRNAHRACAVFATLFAFWGGKGKPRRSMANLCLFGLRSSRDLIQGVFRVRTRPKNQQSRP